MLIKNLLKEKLKSGKPVMGTWNTLAAPLVTEVLGQAGFDFQIIDLEHGPFILDQVYLHVTACENASDCAPIVRIPANEDWMALQVMDQGAHGVMVPHISNKESSRQLISSIKYYPEGRRGFTPFSKAGGFNNKNIASYVETSNRESIAAVIIESKEGLEKLDEILEIDNIDVVYFGAYDLSQALGHPGEVRHQNVIKTIKKGVDLVARKGKTAGGFVPQTRDDVKWLLDLGMRFITYEVDCSILHTHVRGLTDWFAEEIEK